MNKKKKWFNRVFASLLTLLLASGLLPLTVVGGEECRHKYVTMYETKEATCTEEGEVATRCGDCGADPLGTDTIPALGHNWDTWAVTKEATASEEGSRARKCKRCGIEQTEAIPKLPAEHTHTTVTTEEKAPTCTETGTTSVKKCSECGEVLEAATEIPALGHNWGAWTVTKEATATEEGSRKRECQRCGTVETEAISKLETEPETDPETKPETDPETDPETKPETDPETDPTTPQERIDSMTLEVVSVPASLPDEAGQTVTVTYRLTNTGNTILTANKVRMEDGNSTYAPFDSITSSPDDIWDHFEPGQSFMVTVTYTVTNDDVTQGAVIRGFQYFALVWVNKETGIPKGWPDPNLQVGNTFEAVSEFPSNQVWTTIPLRTTVTYFVQHYLEQPDGTYKLEKTDELTGAEGATVTAVPENFPGYVFDDANPNNITSATLELNQRLALKLYYKVPENTPTVTPTVTPTEEPTVTPTAAPTEKPTATPTEKPNKGGKDNTGNKNSKQKAKSNNTNDNVKTRTPKTGDETDTLLWMVILLLSGGGVIYVLDRNRKRNMK